MKKYLFSFTAVIFAVCLASFSLPNDNRLKAAKFDTGDYYYEYIGDQTVTDRQNAANYVNPTTTAPGKCTGGSKLCAIRIRVTLDIFGSPPANPDFTCVSFDVWGIPVVGCVLLQVLKKP